MGGLRWFDSHCHLQGEHARGVDPDAVIERALAAGVERLVCVGTDDATSREAIAIAERNESVSATVGLHPHEASRFDDEWDSIVELASHPAVVGVGETGFDLHYRHSGVADQERVFRAHLELARRVGLPLVVHTREAWPDTWRVLAEEELPRAVVFHCFTGGPKEARLAVEAGAYVSFSGIISFRGATDVRAAARVVPDDRVLVETDSPYLAPEPHRGRTNEPALVGVVGEALAVARAQPAAVVAANTSHNARRVFCDRRAGLGELSG